MLKEKIKKYWVYGFILLLCLVPVIWFFGRAHGVLINGVDTNFPLDPIVWFKRRFFVWYSVSEGGVDFSSSISGMFFHFVQVVPYVLGFGLQQVELISFLFWFSLIIFSSFLLAKLLFPKRTIVQIVFVVFYAFNIYLFNSWENVKVANLALISAIPLAISVLILLRRKDVSLKITTLLTFFTAVAVAGTGINPSYFIAFFLVVFLFFIGDLVVAGERKKKIVNFVVFMGVVCLVNAYWILPTINFIFKNIPTQGSLDKIGFNNWLDSLSENTSIFNIMRVQGAWDWYSLDSATGLPLFIPYATRYFYSLPFLIFSIVPAFLAFVALILRNKKDRGLYLGFSIMLVVGVFLGVGTHLPTGAIFRFFLDHVPFFNLFRSPWYIFTPLVTLAYAGLISLLLYSLNIKFAAKSPIINLVLGVAGIILIGGNLLYSYPLITGKIFRPASPDGFYVTFPEYVFEAGKWLTSDKGGGRIIGYPDDEIENFKWGYRGIESILQLIVDRDVLFSPLNAPDSPISLLIKQFYKDLRRGKVDSMKSMAAKLDIALIFSKEDQASISPGVPEGVKSLPSERFGNWAFYKLPEDTTLPRIYMAKNLHYSYPYDKDTQVFSALRGEDQIINPNDKVVGSINNIADFAGKAILAKNLQTDEYLNFSNSNSKLSNRLTTHDFSKVDYQFDVPEDGFYQPQLERYHVEDFGISTIGSMKVELNGKVEMWGIDRVTDSYVIFNAQEFKKGKYNLAFGLEDDDLVIGGDFENGEKFKRGGYGEGKVSFDIKEDQTGKYLSMQNLDRAEQSADFDVTGFNAFFPYYIELRYKQVYGNNGQIVVEQNTAKTLIKAQSERLPNYPEWQKFSFYYQPVEVDSMLKLFLNAPYTSDPLGTKVFYDDLVVRKVFTNNLVLIEKNKNALTTPKMDFKKNSSVDYVGTVQGARGPHVVVFSENYSPDWGVKVTDLAGKPISFVEKHFSINLYANGWFFENMPESYKFEIYYKPQKLFYIGVVIAGVTFVLSTIVIFRIKK